MNYSITDICSPHQSLKISLCLEPTKVPYFTSLQIRAGKDTLFTRVYSHYSCIKDFLEILRLPDVRIELLDIGGVEIDQNHFLTQLIKKLQEGNLRIPAETAHFHSTITEGLVEKHLELLTYFNPSVLYGIELNTKVSAEIHKKLVRLEQWKQAKKVTYMSMKDCKDVVRMEDFVHFEKIFWVDFTRKMEAEECWQIIKAFRHHDHPRGSYFHISDTEIDINGAIALFDISSKCEKRDTEYVKHIQHFPLDDGVVLEIRLYEDQIIGKKERKEKLGEM
ncbi:hypothetical protein GCK72_021870 [Caenorhabditis remanei]|uniref:DUF38 domain-containing protein n=1 Tax=Caenorhabditis remanei TaxID=31234 RepID=A0A6A5GL35_CAERE|nr:hypothetical protein GCK72_021870 [Caenorhabditis remanei]KAF1755301.1 hypothetical protein GCK72_021870 [Caenorhabditis remanei]